MTTSLQLSLDSIIKYKKLTVYFQCIVANKSATIFAYEALKHYKEMGFEIAMDKPS